MKHSAPIDPERIRTQPGVVNLKELYANRRVKQMGMQAPQPITHKPIIDAVQQRRDSFQVHNMEGTIM